MREKRHKVVNLIQVMQFISVRAPYSNRNKQPGYSTHVLYHAVLRVVGWGRKKIGRNDKIESRFLKRFVKSSFIAFYS